MCLENVMRKWCNNRSASTPSEIKANAKLFNGNASTISDMNNLNRIANVSTSMFKFFCCV